MQLCASLLFSLSHVGFYTPKRRNHVVFVGQARITCPESFKRMTVTVCGMSGKVEEDKDVSKQGMNFIQQGKKAHEE